MKTRAIVDWSMLLLTDIKNDVDCSRMRMQLENEAPAYVFYRLDQVSRKVFWLNIYNAYYILLTREYNQPAKYKADEQLIRIGRRELSLNEIERDILCGYRSTFWGGYFRKLKTREFVKKMAVHDYDPRIHFALSRSVKDGPEIICYRPEIIDTQLTYTAGVFLESNIEIDHENKTVVLHKYFHEYRNAMGGKKQIVEIIFNWMEAEVDDYEFSYKDFNSEDDIIRYGEDYRYACFLEDKD